jgi:hypothetical protein
MSTNKVDFFFVGFPKSGSTTFYYLLKSHPDIFAPAVKEVNFFNTDDIKQTRERLGRHDFQLLKSEDDYSELFHAPSTKVKGDFTPINIFSKDAPRNIYRYNPAAKIIISIREPVSFLRSYHFQFLYNMIEDEPDFIRALALEKSRRAGDNIPRFCQNPFYLYYSSLIQYEGYIRQFTDVFDVGKIKLILFDDILENEAGIYHQLLDFLGIWNSDFVPPQPDRNPSHGLRLRWLRKLMLAPAAKKWLYTRLPSRLLPVGAKISQQVFKKRQDKPFVPPAEIQKLRAQFRPSVIALNHFLNETTGGRDIEELWGYD